MVSRLILPKSDALAWKSHQDAVWFNQDIRLKDEEGKEGGRV